MSTQGETKAARKPLHPQERIFEFINTNSVAINCQYLDLCLYCFRFSSQFLQK